MLSANASMYSIIPSIFWLLYQSFCFSLFRSSAFHFYSALCTTAPWLHRVPQSVPGRLDTAHSRAISARRSVFESSLIFHCHVVYSPLSYSLFCHIIPVTVILCYVSSLAVYRCVNYMSTVYIPYFSTNFRLLLCLFAIFLSIVYRRAEKTPRFLFSAEFSFRFCFTPNRAPQGSPAWSSHSAPSLPFFSGRYTQWKAPTFPQSADGSS